MVAIGALGLILLLAGLLRDAVDLAYDAGGNGCRTLTSASARDLTWALAPVRLLLVAWVIATALGLASKLSADDPARLRGTRTVALVGSAVLALGLMPFVGAIPLMAIWAIVVLWPLSIATLVLVCLRAPVSRGLWLWLTGSWIVVTGMILPVVLAVLTRTGEIPIC